MPRQPTWGTARRSRSPIRTAASSRSLLLVLGSAAMLAVTIFGLHLASGPSLLSPGRLSPPHREATSSCAQCHAEAPSSVSDSCRGCHVGEVRKPRLELVSHTGRPSANAPTCESCHREHRGDSGKLVLDSSCATCHFGSLEQHPVPILAAKGASHRRPGPAGARAPALSFSHAQHLAVFQKDERLEPEDACGRCHMINGTDLQPISFDAHCAGCHSPEGTLGLVEVERDQVQLPIELNQAGEAGPWEQARQMELRHTTLQAAVIHRDPWVLANLKRLRSQSQDPSRLVAVCLRCHPGAVSAWFAPSPEPESRLPFLHGPHLDGGCRTCHESVERWTALPGPPATKSACVECHRESARPRDCVTCHRYHEQEPHSS